MTDSPRSETPADLVARVFDEEERRQQDIAAAEAAQRGPAGSFDAEQLTLRQGLRRGGKGLIGFIGLLGFVETLETSAFAVIAPDIQKSLDVSDGTIGAIGGAFGILFLLGSIPLSSLADRMPRKLVVGAAMSLWSVVVMVTSAISNAFLLFIARMGAGLGQSYYIPVAGPMLMDGYPIGARAKVFALNGWFQMAGQALGPLLAGLIVLIATGDEGWRWVFVTMGVMGIPLAISAFFVREPRRGSHEMQAVLGKELEQSEDELPISLSVAFERLRKIKSFYYYLTGMAAIGFAIFTTIIFINLHLEEHFELSAFERGVFGSLTVLPGFVGAAVSGKRADALFKEHPSRAMVFIGVLVVTFGAIQVVGIWMPTVLLLGIFLGASNAFARAAFAILPGVIASVIPYRLRSRGTALVGIYMFLFGAFLGAVITGMLSDVHGEQTALTIVILPATLVGGSLMAYGSRFIEGDIALVIEELHEEQDEAERMAGADAADIPVLQVRNLDFSYGKVQVLFDIGFEVRRGESLALLGTNGAGKSTVLRVVSGLGVPQRGVVRLHGRTITYADPGMRAKIGIVQLAGGKAIFPGLSVEENLRMAGFRYGPAELEPRLERAYDLFPVVADRRSATAGDFSGGQQQMLSLAMALMHDPEILMIDELSLGLAPVTVQSLLEVVERLRAEGQTMIIVEQSLNVALAVADRAIFLEKGQVRFEGPAQDLVERDDLARAVFLGQSGSGG